MSVNTELLNKIDMQKRIIFTEQEQASTITIEEVEQMARDGKYPVLVAKHSGHIVPDGKGGWVAHYHPEYQEFEFLDEAIRFMDSPSWHLDHTNQLLVEGEQNTIWWEDVPDRSYVMTKRPHQNWVQFGLWDISDDNKIPRIDYGSTFESGPSLSDKGFKCYLIATPTEE